MQFAAKNTYSVIEVADIKLNHFCMDHRHVIHSEHEFSISKKKKKLPSPPSISQCSPSLDWRYETAPILEFRLGYFAPFSRCLLNP